ncbi:MAG: hypothetical protein IPL33_11220 [Sphingobacteriales bacterium]|nr:hypothetical protein [Sphingobacteriales bacterium]
MSTRYYATAWRNLGLANSVGQYSKHYPLAPPHQIRCWGQELWNVALPVTYLRVIADADNDIVLAQRVFGGIDSMSLRKYADDDGACFWENYLKGNVTSPQSTTFFCKPMPKSAFIWDYLTQCHLNLRPIPYCASTPKGKCSGLTR